MHRVKADSESCGLDRSLRQRLRGTWVAAAEQREAAIGNAVAAKPELAVRQAERVARLATAARSNAASQARQRLQGLGCHGILGQTSHAT
ncbi:hypothetical protein BK635_16920 [Pseudomonas chlororaphis]|nr:hypothetical protein BK635_16920 [Pseudomonas chlororaphis]